MQEKSPIKQRILKFLTEKGISQYEFYKNTGITRGVLSQNNGISEENIARFLDYFPEVSAEWLITGKGSPLTKIQPSAHEDTREAIPAAEANHDKMRPIPLVSETVAAGFGSEFFSISEKDVKEYYIIPKFRFCNVDFMIEVSGDSMVPRFHPGDIIACSILTKGSFIQWGKSHVIATREQGLLVKRILPDEDKKHIRAVSENKEYPAFSIPLDEVMGLALVVGSVHLE